MRLMKKRGEFHPKDWGYEEWFENNPKYCMKLLCCKDGKWSSKGKFHYHGVKDETFLVIEGTLVLEVIDDLYKRHETFILEVGDSFRVHPGIKHRFKSYGAECKFIEASTPHAEEDSYRCYHDGEGWIVV